MTTKDKLRTANFVCTFLMVVSAGCGILGALLKSSAFWLAAKLLLVAGLILWYVCYRLQAQLALEKRKKRTESGLPLG